MRRSKTQFDIYSLQLHTGYYLQHSLFLQILVFYILNQYKFDFKKRWLLFFEDLITDIQSLTPMAFKTGEKNPYLPEIPFCARITFNLSLKRWKKQHLDHVIKCFTTRRCSASVDLVIFSFADSDRCLSFALSYLK